MHGPRSIDADEQVLQVEPELDGCDSGSPLADLMHGPGREGRLRPSGSNPIEVASDFAIDDRVDEAARSMEFDDRGLRHDIGHEQFFRDWLVDRAIDVSDVPSEQVTELQVVVGGMIVSV